MMTDIIVYLFQSIFLVLNSQLLDPMLGLVFVFGVFRLTWIILAGGYFNDNVHD